MITYKSDLIFELADKYQIPLDRTIQSEFLDETYESFCNDYIEASQKRDNLLKEHLVSTSNLFRTFLPWQQNIFHTIFQLQWYYDEIIIYDPIIIQILHSKNEDKESKKEMLRNIISYLGFFKDSIDFGFLLFCGHESLIDNFNTRNYSKEFEGLMSNSEIREELDKLVYVAKLEKYDENELIDFTIRSFYRGRHGFYPIVKKPEKPLTDGGLPRWTIDLIGSNYQTMTLEDVKNAGAYSQVYDTLKEEYPIEFVEILRYLNISSELNSPVLFDRKLDELVLANINSDDKSRLKSNVQSFYNLTLPFVDGVPPNRLLELRTQIPNAFLDFRNSMFEIILDLEKNGFQKEIFELKIQQKVKPLVSKLDVEMKNSLLKTKVLGIGVPIISGVGAWGLWQVGIDTFKIAGLLFGGAGIPAEIKVVTDRLVDKNNAKLNPFYYLWKAKTGK